MKLWKVTVRNWGWSSARTYYFKDKAEAREFSGKYTASDGVEYAGNYTEKNAKALLCEEDEED